MLPTDYQTFIALSKYARWRPDDARRETWEETVNRLIDFWAKRFKRNKNVSSVLPNLKEAILNLSIMPSMRSLMTAGEALDRDHVAGYNCAYVAVDEPRVFDEIMYVLMCGTGVGFSVERQYINQLPSIAEEFFETDTTIIVPDSKIGWATSYRELVSMLYNGKKPKWDLSRIRPAGSPLKTFGGRASGPEPLEQLFRFTCEVFSGARGRRLSSLECHDLVCKIADAIVVGGVRRSALISLSNLTDERLRTAKSGEWYKDNPQRRLANNSVCYTESPDVGIFIKEWLSLYESKSGERGIFNREAAKKQVGLSGRRDINHEFGTNPCSEILLRPKQFCNLSEVVVRSDDSFNTLSNKVVLATILGTLQSTLTDFRYLSKKWKENTEEERLLGVSLTGIQDHPIIGEVSPDAMGWLKNLKEEAIETNKRWAEYLDIPPATAITCVKPSGTVSQLVNSSSGIHARHSLYYTRTVRADKLDPLARFMCESGFPVEADIYDKEHTQVFSFPIKSPKTAKFRDDRTAIQQLELWEMYQDYWCEHKPSITITVKEQEWLEVGTWVYKKFNKLSGVSFLPHSNHVYLQAPYQEITKEQYEEALAKMPKNVDWSKVSDYEKEDHTKASHELACGGAVSCEI